MKKLTPIILLLAISALALNAQVKYHASYSSVSIAGTSTFHDWDMTSEKANCDIALNFDGANITGFSSLIFTVDAASLKSHHSGMDKDAYKALNSDKYPEISFASSYANIRPNGTNSYLTRAKGKLTIAGVSKDIWIFGVATVNPADMTVQATGSAKLKMSEFNVEPPRFMFGAVKTGDEVTVKFNLSLKK
jgi:polyisoprenoid-binding protein YceI